jgi:DNA-binding NarL/FixJ family response regulator
MERAYTILLADDHIRFRRGLKKFVEEMPGIQVTGEAGNGRELFQLLQESPPQLVILDIALPELRAEEGIQLIKSQYPGTRVLIMVMDPEAAYLTFGLVTGAAGVLVKQYVAGQLFQAISTIRQGKIYLPAPAPGDSSPPITTPWPSGHGWSSGGTC